ncbi:MAG: hypothetical protein P4L34_04775 [Paludibacter sp.]|nr:hypothetical protein [Paludibacter sp.]
MKELLSFSIILLSFWLTSPSIDAGQLYCSNFGFELGSLNNRILYIWIFSHDYPAFSITKVNEIRSGRQAARQFCPPRKNILINYMSLMDS